MPERLQRVAGKLAERHQIKIRPLDLKQFKAEVARVRMLYNAAWDANWGNIPMTDAEFDDLAKQLKPVVVPELVLFAEVRGELAGFALALPDLNVALRHMHGSLFPSAGRRRCGTAGRSTPRGSSRWACCRSFVSPARRSCCTWRSTRTRRRAALRTAKHRGSSRTTSSCARRSRTSAATRTRPTDSTTRRSGHRPPADLRS